jgi:ribonuclease HI
VAEYEALLLGTRIGRDMGIKVLEVIGDSDLVVLQVKNMYAAKNDRLKWYRHAVWDTIELFDAFSIKEVPREQNMQLMLWM